MATDLVFTWVMVTPLGYFWIMVLATPATPGIMGLTAIIGTTAMVSNLTTATHIAAAIYANRTRPTPIMA